MVLRAFLVSCLWATCLLHTSYSLATLTLNKVPPEIKLEGDLGGRVGGGAWSSSELKGKIHLIFYVAPSAESLNEEARETLHQHSFPGQFFASLAIINMKASMWPNFLISEKLAKSQKQNPRTLYVEDREKVLVEKWNLADDSSDVLLLDSEGKVLFSVDGKLTKAQIDELIALIQKELAYYAAEQVKAQQTHGKTKTEDQQKKTPKKENG